MIESYFSDNLLYFDASKHLRLDYLIGDSANNVSMK